MHASYESILFQSTNGTFVNCVNIGSAEYELKVGDVLGIGCCFKISECYEKDEYLVFKLQKIAQTVDEVDLSSDDDNVECIVKDEYPKDTKKFIKLLHTPAEVFVLSDNDTDECDDPTVCSDDDAPPVDEDEDFDNDLAPNLPLFFASDMKQEMQEVDEYISQLEQNPNDVYGQSSTSPCRSTSPTREDSPTNEYSLVNDMYSLHSNSSGELSDLDEIEIKTEKPDTVPCWTDDLQPIEIIDDDDGEDSVFQGWLDRLSWRFTAMERNKAAKRKLESSEPTCESPLKSIKTSQSSAKEIVSNAASSSPAVTLDIMDTVESSILPSMIECVVSNTVNSLTSGTSSLQQIAATPNLVSPVTLEHEHVSSIKKITHSVQSKKSEPVFDSYVAIATSKPFRTIFRRASLCQSSTSESSELQENYENQKNDNVNTTTAAVKQISKRRYTTTDTEAETALPMNVSKPTIAQNILTRRESHSITTTPRCTFDDMRENANVSDTRLVGMDASVPKQITNRRQSKCIMIDPKPMRARRKSTASSPPKSVEHTEKVVDKTKKLFKQDELRNKFKNSHRSSRKLKAAEEIKEQRKSKLKYLADSNKLVVDSVIRAVTKPKVKMTENNRGAFLTDESSVPPLPASNKKYATTKSDSSKQTVGQEITKSTTKPKVKLTQNNRGSFLTDAAWLPPMASSLKKKPKPKEPALINEEKIIPAVSLNIVETSIQKQMESNRMIAGCIPKTFSQPVQTKDVVVSCPQPSIDTEPYNSEVYSTSAGSVNASEDIAPASDVLDEQPGLRLKDYRIIMRRPTTTLKSILTVSGKRRPKRGIKFDDNNLRQVREYVIDESLEQDRLYRIEKDREIMSKLQYCAVQNAQRPAKPKSDFQNDPIHDILTAVTSWLPIWLQEKAPMINGYGFQPLPMVHNYHSFSSYLS